MKKLLIFLMIAIPLVVILVVNLTVSAVAGMVSISVDSITLNMTEISATIDEIVKLEATVLPKNATNKEVKWKSTDEDVAKVDLNGNVTFVGFGSGYITAITEDGHKIATCYFYATDTKVHQIKLTSSQIQDGNYYVGINSTLSLESQILPMEALNKYVVYSSEDESIATVDSNGLVTGKKEGRVKITSTSEADSSISDSVVVEVVKPVERVIVNSKSEVTSSNTYQLSYGIYPTDATISKVNYISADPAIATVSPSGLVTFLKPGKVKIIISSVEGGKTEEVEVESTSGYAKDLIINENMINASINDGGIEITYNTVPQSVDVDVEFSSDDENIAYVDDSGYIQFMGGGSTFIRARIKKSEDEYIEKIIGIYVESPATKIIIDDEYTIATKTMKLSPSSYPNNSTNKSYYFYSEDIETAIVDEFGLVTFVCDRKASVEITIFANEDKSVFKKVKINYTNGYPTDLLLDQDVFNVNYGESIYFGYDFVPEKTDVGKADLQFEIIEQNKLGEDGEVVEFISENEIKAIGGGRAVIKASYINDQQQRIIKFIEVNVNRFVDDVQFESELDLYNGEYYTCEQTVGFNLKTLTLDAANKALKWNLNSSVAIKSGENEIKFNNAGSAEILVESLDGKFKKSFSIRYIKSNLINATLKNFNSVVYVGDEIEIEIESLFPSNGVHNLSLKASNQITSSELGKVIEIVDKNKFKAVAGGIANLTVSLSNLKFNFTISSIRNAQSIVIEQEGVKTTNSKILLKTEVLPIDTTNPNVYFESLTPEIAEIDGEYVVFSKNGVATIRAISEDGAIEKIFNIEKIEKGSGEVAFTEEPIEMDIGDSNIINISNIDFDYVEENVEYMLIQQPEEQGLDVIIFDETNRKIEAVSIGKATLNVILNNSQGVEKIVSFEIIVKRLSENIEFTTDLPLIQRDYVTALNEVDLSFNVLPQNATNKTYSVKISEFIANSNNDEVIDPYIQGEKLIFSSSGTAIINVNAADGGASRKFRVKYTGGVAIDAELNVEQMLNDKQELVLNIGQEMEFKVENWVPQNTVNKTIKVKEDSHSQGVQKVVEISENIVSAVAGGWSNIVVELSGEVTKIIKVVVATKVEQINIDNIVTPQTSITLRPTVLPENASNKTLNYKFVDGSTENSIARISGSSIIFNKAGEVIVIISATDGSEVSKTISVKSTLGYVNNFSLAFENKIIKKGQETKINIAAFEPSDAIYKTFNYKIYGNEPSDGSNNSVIELSSTGVVKGLYSGKALVRVYTVNYYEEEIYVDCLIEVYSPIEDIIIKFYDFYDPQHAEKQLQVVNGDFLTTSQKEIGYEIFVSPDDANKDDIIVESSNENIAVIFEDKIKFKNKGSVTITFREKSSDANAKIVTKKFLYTNELLSAEIDQSDFINKKLALEAGQSYKIKMLNYNPLDINDLVFTIENVEERRVDFNLPIYNFSEDGTFEALNGGIVIFDLKVNEINVGRYSIEVFRKSSGIKVDSTEAFVKGKTYKINAMSIPSDTYQKDLIYEVVDSNSKAVVDQYGEVTLNDEKQVIVRIRVAENDNIEPVYVTVTYSNSVKKLILTCSKDPRVLFFGDYADIVVSSEPYGADAFEFDYNASNNYMVEIERPQNTENIIRVRAKEIAGDVAIFVYVKGKIDIRSKIDFKIEAGVSALELELDNLYDGNGQIGGYRVWGNKFLDSEGKTNNTYQMKVKTIMPEVARDQVELIWTSDNEEIATVEKGLVTFKKTGIVTISVEPAKQARGYIVNDSYTFKIVEGVNIFEYAQFKKVTKEEDDRFILLSNIALQTDLRLPKKLKLAKNLYGNGFSLDFTGIGDSEKIKIQDSGITLDNVNIYGEKPHGELQYLSQLEGVGRAIVVDGGDKHISNIKIKNVKVEYAFIAIEVAGADVNVAGCIIKNTFSSGLVVGRANTGLNPSNVTVKDCVFNNSLLGAISFTPEMNPENINYRSSLTIEGNVYLFNWINIKEFTYDSEQLRNFVPDIDEQIQEMLSSGAYNRFIYTDPVTKNHYIMIGIISKLKIDASVAGTSLNNLINFNTFGNVSYGGQTNPDAVLSYVRTPIKGSIKVGNLAKYAVADCDLEIYTQNGFVAGSSVMTIDVEVTGESIRNNKYYDDGDMYEKIRQAQ